MLEIATDGSKNNSREYLVFFVIIFCLFAPEKCVRYKLNCSQIHINCSTWVSIDNANRKASSLKGVAISIVMYGPKALRVMSLAYSQERTADCR